MGAQIGAMAFELSEPSSTPAIGETGSKEGMKMQQDRKHDLDCVGCLHNHYTAPERNIFRDKAGAAQGKGREIRLYPCSQQG